jgi:hypothetical protein
MRHRGDDQAKLLALPETVHPVRRAELAFQILGRAEEFRQYYESNRFGDMKISTSTDKKGGDKEKSETRSSLSSLTGDDVSLGTDRIFFAKSLPHLCASLVGFCAVEAALELDFADDDNVTGEKKDSSEVTGKASDKSTAATVCIAASMGRGWSHILLPVMMRRFASIFEKKSSVWGKDTLSNILLLSISAFLSLYTCRLLSNASVIFSHLQFQQFIQTMIPSTILLHIQPAIKIISNIFQYMFPLSELKSSYNTISSFFDGNPMNQQLLHDMLCHLFFVTFHIQMGLGYIGIAFLMSEQTRKNMLIRMDIDSKNNDTSKSNHLSISNVTNGGNNRNQSVTSKRSGGSIVDHKYDPSRKFRRSAPSFILLTVLPYMFQIIVFGK